MPGTCPGHRDLAVAGPRKKSGKAHGWPVAGDNSQGKGRRTKTSGQIVRRGSQLATRRTKEKTEPENDRDNRPTRFPDWAG